MPKLKLCSGCNTMKNILDGSVCKGCNQKPNPPQGKEEWEEGMKIKLYNYGRLSDKQELSDMAEEIMEDIESLAEQAEKRGYYRGIKENSIKLTEELAEALRDNKDPVKEIVEAIEKRGVIQGEQNVIRDFEESFESIFSEWNFTSLHSVVKDFLRKIKERESEHGISLTEDN